MSSEQDGGDAPRGIEYKKTVGGNLVVWCPECGDPMHLKGETWEHELEQYIPECPDCDPDEWIDFASVKIAPEEAEAMVQ